MDDFNKIKKERITLLVFIIISGFSLSVFFHYITSTYLNLGYPYTTFLFLPADNFRIFCVFLVGIGEIEFILEILLVHNFLFP